MSGDGDGRSKRPRDSKGGNSRVDLLNRLREARSRGERYNPDVKEDDDIFEEVDEREYNKIVRKRRDDDWIVDDEQGGYVEDGREIFDDYDDEDDLPSSKNRIRKQQSTGTNKSGKSADNDDEEQRRAAEKRKQKDIRAMFNANANASTRRNVAAASSEHDTLLDELIGELHHTGGNAQQRTAPAKTVVAPAIQPAPTNWQNAATANAYSSGFNFDFDFDSGDYAAPARPKASELRAKAEAAPVPVPAPVPDSSAEPMETETLKLNRIDDEADALFAQAEREFAERSAKQRERAEQRAKMEREKIEKEKKEKEKAQAQEASQSSAPNWNQAAFATAASANTTSDGDGNQNENESEIDASNFLFETDEVSTVQNAAEEEDDPDCLRFFWLDAYEDAQRAPGTVYLFGKVEASSITSKENDANSNAVSQSTTLAARGGASSKWASCCVIVQGIERRVYLLPRQLRARSGGQSIKAEKQEENDDEADEDEKVSMLDVYKEFSQRIAPSHSVKRFKSRTVTRSYAFEQESVPWKSEYLEVRYSADSPPLPADLQGETFSRVFGTHTSALELLLLDVGMRGPCWLRVRRSSPVSDETPSQSQSQQQTWCTTELQVTPDAVKLERKSAMLPSPPITTVTLQVKTLTNPSTHQHEIVAYACLVHNATALDRPAPTSGQAFTTHFCGIARPAGTPIAPDVTDSLRTDRRQLRAEMAANERHLLAQLVAKLHLIDPDLILAHDAVAFHLDVLLGRLEALRIPHASKIGRLRRAHLPARSRGGGLGAAAAHVSTSFCGRLVLDTLISAKELLRARNYSMTDLVRQLFKAERVEVDDEGTRQCFSTAPGVESLLNQLLADACYSLRIANELQVLSLATQISSICGSTLGRTLLGGRSERNEMLLLHAFTARNFIAPDKYQLSGRFGGKRGGKGAATSAATEEAMIDLFADWDDPQETAAAADDKRKAKKGRRKPAYVGGLVLEPKRGFYDRFILLLDFNSLYPSIIQEFNVCFTTIRKPQVEGGGEDATDDIMAQIASIELPDEKVEEGILPSEIRKLVVSRREVKKRMKMVDPARSAAVYQQLDIKQKALKLTANSMYGCLGFSNSRFYAPHLAALVTAKGRQILMRTKELVETNVQLEVIYGDTDSLMINTNSTQLEDVYRIGSRIKTEVNKLYKHLEIEIDGVFKSMLLLKKKKYAALVVHPTGQVVDGQPVLRFEQETKGLDMVRRDWCPLARDASEFVLAQLFSADSRDAAIYNVANYLERLAADVRGSNLAIDRFVITKQLGKNAEHYADQKAQAHVQVALRWNSRAEHVRKLQAGDVVPFVVCADQTNLPAAQRAYHVEEVTRSSPPLQVDADYYLAQQIHPVVARLVEPIDGLTPARLAEWLGLDPSAYRTSARSADHDDGGLQDRDADAHDADSDDLRAAFGDSVRPFSFRCAAQPSCGARLDRSDVLGDDGRFAFGRCDRCSLPLRNADILIALRNSLSLCCREAVARYYAAPLRCDESTCAYRTACVPLKTHRGRPVCPACSRGILWPEQPAASLFEQLRFFERLFDPARAERRIRATLNRANRPGGQPQPQTLSEQDVNELNELLISGTISKLLGPLHQLAVECRQQCAYGTVNLTDLLGRIYF